MNREDERQEVDAAEESAAEDKASGSGEPAVDTAEEVAEREAEEWEDRDQLSGDEPPPA